MKVVESILKKNPCYTANQKIKVKGLMLHSVGCPQPSAEVFVKNWNKESYNSACVHAFIDANTGTIYQTLPWNHRGWHGGGSSNNTHIGVEMCEPSCIQYQGGSTFVCSDTVKAKEAAKRTYDAAVELFAYLCNEYGLDPAADGVIVSHAEGYKRGIASNHGDPEHLWNQLGIGYSMDTFRKAVKAAVTKDKPSDKDTLDKTETALYRVQTGAYKQKANAAAQAERIRAAGFENCLVMAGGLYKIQVGAYKNKENAYNMRDQLKAAGIAGFITTEAWQAAGAVVQKTIDVIAKEVIAGKWGNGADRVKRLKAAGYDPDAVQAKVNALL